jgi:hypothetical protein
MTTSKDTRDRRREGWFTCQWCRTFCGHYPESVVSVPLEHRRSGEKVTLRLCPRCALTDTSSVWKVWHREEREQDVVEGSSAR